MKQIQPTIYESDLYYPLKYIPLFHHHLLLNHTLHQYYPLQGGSI